MLAQAPELKSIEFFTRNSISSTPSTSHSYLSGSQSSGSDSNAESSPKSSRIRAASSDAQTENTICCLPRKKAKNVALFLGFAAFSAGFIVAKYTDMGRDGPEVARGVELGAVFSAGTGLLLVLAKTVNDGCQAAYRRVEACTGKLFSGQSSREQTVTAETVTAETIVHVNIQRV